MGMSFIVSAVDSVKQHIRPPALIVLESTTYPGTTDELVVAELESVGLTLDQDFFACFSPERVDPGNALFQTRNIPKVVGGVSELSTKLGVTFYQQVLEKVHPVSSARVAEMAKLLENTFRAVNIGLVNELALLAERMGDCAGQPFGRPGLVVGWPLPAGDRRRVEHPGAVHRHGRGADKRPAAGTA
jgi:UDP-N-acetyl-D-glucosamine dehydrogenase